ncbi:MAG: LysO family transporter [Conexivisphaerales archaeon]
MKIRVAFFPFVLLLSFLAGSMLSELVKMSQAADSTLQQTALAIFILVVSYDVGSKMRSSDIRSIMNQTALLAASCIIGSIVAGLIFALIIGFNVKLSLGISLGMGWYTFDGPALAGYAGAAAGAMGFFSNFFRELLTLLFYLPASAATGRVKAIPMGGATTMDTTLTVMRSKNEPRITALAFAHGALISLFVPLLVTLAIA